MLRGKEKEREIEKERESEQKRASIFLATDVLPQSLQWLGLGTRPILVAMKSIQASHMGGLNTIT